MKSSAFYTSHHFTRKPRECGVHATPTSSLYISFQPSADPALALHHIPSITSICSFGALFYIEDERGEWVRKWESQQGSFTSNQLHLTLTNPSNHIQYPNPFLLAPFDLPTTENHWFYWPDTDTIFVHNVKDLTHIKTTIQTMLTSERIALNKETHQNMWYPNWFEKEKENQVFIKFLLQSKQKPSSALWTKKKVDCDSVCC